MDLETGVQVNVKKKKKLTVGTAIGGVCMIAIPIIIALCITMPNIAQALLAEKSVIFKGMLMGMSTLPVLLFITIKGGKEWYKRWWSWVAVGITTIALVLIIVLGSVPVGTPGGDPGMMPNDPSMGMGMGVGIF